jgi:SAM-dependent methyltransferase
MGKMESTPWYREAFDELYTEIYGHRDEREAVAAVDLLKRHVSVAGSLVLDLACGAGRHMEALEAAGAKPVGLDLSASLLTEARRGGRSELIRGDMRALPFRTEVFDGAVSMFTSFGYFPERREEVAVLVEAARCLKAGGWFVLDYMNSNLVRSSLEPLTRRRAGRLDVVERRRLNAGRDRVIKKVEVFSGGRRMREFTEEVRLLSRGEMAEMMGGAGLRPRLVLGDYDGAPYVAADSPRLITLGVKE